MMGMTLWQSKKAADAMARFEDEAVKPLPDRAPDRASLTNRRYLMAGLATLPVVAACNPTVRLEAPAEPIEINLNIRIQQEVRIRIDRELDDLFDEEEDIF